MKKKNLLSLLLIALLAVLLCSCGGKRTVSDTELEWVVQDYINYGGELAGSDYIDYDYKFTHESSHEANADIVDITLTFEYPYGTKTTTISQVYQYDKSSKTWFINRSGEWSEPVSTFDEKAFLTDWENEHFDQYGYVDIEKIDFASGTVTLSYDYDCIDDWNREHNYTGEGTYSIETNNSGESVAYIQIYDYEANLSVESYIFFTVEDGARIAIVLF